MKLKGNVRLFAELFQCVQQFRNAFFPADLPGIDEAVRSFRCGGIRLARKEDFVVIPGSDDGHLFRRKPEATDGFFLGLMESENPIQASDILQNIFHAERFSSVSRFSGAEIRIWRRSEPWQMP